MSRRPPPDAIDGAVAPEARPEKVTRVDLWLQPASPPMEAVVAEANARALYLEDALNVRRVPRRPHVQRTFDGVSGALLSNVAVTHLTHRDGARLSLSTRRRKRTRYDHPEAMSSQLREAINAHERTGYLDVERGEYSPIPGTSRETVIRAGTSLVAAMEARGITLFDLEYQPGAEIVVLKGQRLNGETADRVDYPESVTSRRLRAEMAALNHHLRYAKVTFDVDFGGTGPLVNVRQRFLRRVYTRGSFKCGGRLFGGWWINLDADERLDRTMIDGEPVSSLDFVTMGAALAYAHVGLPMPAADAYTVGPLLNTDDVLVTLSRNRVWKKAFSALLSSETGEDRERWPKGLAKHSQGVTWETAYAALRAYHAPIAHLFTAGIGQRLANVEANILVRSMLTLLKQGITSLPAHDKLVVAKSAVAAARVAMLEAFTHYTKQTGQLAIEE